MYRTAELVEAAYDEIAAGYDQYWSVHIRAPQRRLTGAMALSRGMRCVDLGCGTGVDTLDMARLTAPTEVCAVDCSPKMLEQASERARARGYRLRTVCMEAETFVQQAEPSSFHAASVRFCLAYLPWRHIVRGLANLLLPEGQLGILTNLGTSAPQAWEVYRGMIDELGVPRVDLPVPSSLSDLEHALQHGGFQIAQSWTETFRLRFDSGQHVAAWLEESGFIAHPKLRAAPIALRRALWAAFASRIERYREPHGIPLDFELAGVVAVHSCSAHPPQTD